MARLISGAVRSAILFLIEGAIGGGGSPPPGGTPGQLDFSAAANSHHIVTVGL